MTLHLASLFKVSLEEIQDEQVPVVEYNEELQTDTDDAVAELVEAHDDVTETVAQADQIEELGEQLEITVTIATESLKTGGMNAAEAAQFRATVADIYSKVGLPTQALPSLESFGDERLAYSEESFAEVRAKLKAFWETLKKVLKEAWARVTKFFAQLFDATAQLEKHAAAVYKMAKSTKGSVSGKIAVVNPDAANYQGKTDLDSIGKGLHATADIYDKAVGAVVRAYQAVSSNDVLNDVNKDPAKAFSGFKITGVSGSVSGGLTVSTNDKGLSFGSKAQAGSAEITAPSPVVVAAFTRNVINFCKSIRGSKSELDSLGKAKEAFLEAAANKTNGEKALNALKSFHRQVEAEQKKREQVLTTIAKAGIQAAAAGLKTAERSLKAHKETPAPKALAAPAAA